MLYRSLALPFIATVAARESSIRMNGAVLSTSCADSPTVSFITAKSNSDLVSDVNMLDEELHAYISGLTASCATAPIDVPCATPNSFAANRPHLFYCDFEGSVSTVTTGPVPATLNSDDSTTVKCVLPSYEQLAQASGGSLAGAPFTLSIKHYAKRQQGDSYNLNAVAIPYSGLFRGNQFNINVDAPSPPNPPPSPSPPPPPPSAKCGSIMKEASAQPRSDWTMCMVTPQMTAYHATQCNALDVPGSTYGCWHYSGSENVWGSASQACMSGQQHTTRYNGWGGTNHYLVVCVLNSSM